MKISKINLKALFSKGLKPKQEAFYNWMDSYWHKDELIDISAVKSLQNALDGKLDNSVQDSILTAFNDAVSSSVSGIKGEAFPNSFPTAYDPANYPNGLYEKWDVNTIGTYINFKDASSPTPQPIQVTIDDLKNNFVQILMTNGVAKKSLKPISDNFSVIPFSNIIKFEFQKSISKITLSSDLNYSYNGLNAILNSIQVHEIIPNGYSINFSSSFATHIQSDIDYTKPISVLFTKPISANLKPLAIVINMSEVDPEIPLPKYKVNVAGGAEINTWFEWFQFPNRTIATDDCVFNVGYFDYQGNKYVGCNFTKVGTGATGRWANFAILEAEWQPNTIYEINNTSVIGARFKTTSIKPTKLITGNTSNFTLLEIL